MSTRISIRTGMMIGTALSAAMMFPSIAMAQAAAEDGGLEEIVVTAQKREQSVQDVPIAVTALSESVLQANRVVDVTDLSGLAPGVQVRVSAGGSSLPSFTIRGAVSYGVVPGSDKQVSMYLDGVYLSSPRGAVFELPDTQRIEILRGPQGTLFGRNATAGAVSITTRDPDGDAKVKADLTIGNYAQKRMRLSMSTPEFGPFSAYYTFVKNERRGDMKNLDAGKVWDRSASPDGDIRTSPKYLGSKDSTSHFLAVKFQPSDTFKMVYKFDRFSDHPTPEGTALVNINSAAPLTGALLQALLTSQPDPARPGQVLPISSYVTGNDKRPKAVHNGYAVPGDLKVFGHSLTTTWEPTDSITVKNTMAYRKTHLFAASAIDGFSSLTFTQAALVPYATFLSFSTYGAANGAAHIQDFVDLFAGKVGQPFIGIATQPVTTSRQWSDELVVNYNSKLLTLTAGAIWFKGKDYSGGPLHLQNTNSFTVVPNGVFTIGREGTSFNNQTSVAAYAQAEIHATSQLDFILGARITKDKKDGTFTYGSHPATTTIPYLFKKTKPNWLIGVNFKPNQDTLLYAKFSTAFVSGGSVATIDFPPETATSYEAGVKTSLLDNHLQLNLAVYSAKYKNFQTAQGAQSFTDILKQYLQDEKGFTLAQANSLVGGMGTFVLPQGGPVKAKGFEFDFTAAPTQGFTMGGSLGYSKTKFEDVLPLLLLTNKGPNAPNGVYSPTLRPKWTGGLWGQYEVPLNSEDMKLVMRADGSWRSKMLTDSNSLRGVAVFAPLKYSEATWIVNSRISVKGINLGGLKAEAALWAKNLTDDKSVTFNLINGGFEAGANFQAARTYGLDLSLEF